MKPTVSLQQQVQAIVSAMTRVSASNHRSNRFSFSNSHNSHNSHSSTHSNAPSTFWLLLIVAVWIVAVNFANLRRFEPELAATLQHTTPITTTTTTTTIKPKKSASSSSVRLQQQQKQQQQQAVAPIESSAASASLAAKKESGASRLMEPVASGTAPKQEKSSATTTATTATTEYHVQIPSRSTTTMTNLVLPGDFIYYPQEKSWNSAPIVMESHKLIFFTIPKVGCTVWKQLFRRMMGYSDWMSQDYETYQPHNPAANGLQYLYNYTTEQASEMMTSPDWTRAIMLRDPKQRLLSAFLDKSVGNYHKHIIDRCCPDESCVEGAQTVPGFLALCAGCSDDHWRPQNDRVDYKYWPYMDHIGHVETAAVDARDLLERVGAWDEFGASGWGRDGSLPIFGTKEASGAGMNHSTFAEWKVWEWYTPDSEQLVERFYRSDYENPLFQFTRNTCLTCMT